MTKDVDFSREHGISRIQCPVHNGLHYNCVINHDFETWKCWSYHCEEEIGNKLSDLAKYLGEDFTSKIVKGRTRTKKVTAYLSKSCIPSYHEVPYFESRGFLKNTIKAYKAFIDHNLNSRLYKRAVIPVFDDEGNLVGLTGRALYKSHIKWKHFPANFPKNDVLYNLTLAKNHIINNTVILVEGPLDVWRLYEAGIYNSVAILGTSISQQQINLLKKYKVERIIVIFDPDDAGQQATLNPHKLVGDLLNHFDVYSLRHLMKNDVGDTTVLKLKPLIKEIRYLCSQPKLSQ